MDVDQRWKELYGDNSEEAVDEESPSSTCEFQEWQRHVPPVSRRDQVGFYFILKFFTDGNPSAKMLVYQ